MAVDPVTSSTGDTILPTIGTLAYNGITFSALYQSKIDGDPTQDEAGRTTKFMTYLLDVEGVVTLPDGAQTTDDAWRALRKRLSQDGAPLTYTGQGFGDLNVNQPNGTVRDVKWGPIPKVLAFQPLGAGRSAAIHWQVSTCIPELKNQAILQAKKTLGVKSLGLGGNQIQNNVGPSSTGPVVQFNYGATVTYDEDGYANLSIKGTLEIPLTRTTADARTLADTVDNYRQAWLNIQVDLTKYKVTRRSFEYSRDKRTINWEYAAVELPPMGLPPGATKARGTMSVHSAGKRSIAGLSFANFLVWTCTLRCTYTIRADFPQRLAAQAFYHLLWFRMHQSQFGILPNMLNVAGKDQQAAPPQNDVMKGLALRGGVFALSPAAGPFLAGGDMVKWFMGTDRAAAPQVQKEAPKLRRAQLMDFGFDEGVYEDAKTITFHANWMLLCTWSSLLIAAGVWRWLGGTTGGNNWAVSVQDVMGWRSWQSCRLDPTVDLIVDLGGGTPPTAPPFS